MPLYLTNTSSRMADDGGAAELLPGGDSGAGGGSDPVTDQLVSNLNASGRNTLFCCLSCGMPFSFPDDSYTSSDTDVQDLVRFVHSIRKVGCYIR